MSLLWCPSRRPTVRPTSSDCERCSPRRQANFEAVGNNSRPRLVCIIVVGDKGCIRVLAISGSLRRLSSNTALVGAVARLAPEIVDVSIYRGLADLPPFNPDIDDDRVPAAVASFRGSLQACDAVLISSPEYAHGVPGVLKNALDWVVSSGELVDALARAATHSPSAPSGALVQ